MPIEIVITWIPHQWVLGPLACNLFAAVGEYSTYVSVMTMMSFTFERYTAVCYPLRPSLHSDVKRTRRILLGIWILAALPALAMTKYIKVKSMVTHNETFFLSTALKRYVLDKMKLLSYIDDRCCNFFYSFTVSRISIPEWITLKKDWPARWAKPI